MHVISAVDQSNTSHHDESIEAHNEMYGNTVTLKFEHLDNVEKDKGTKADVPLHVSHAVDTDQTIYKSKTEISTEEHSNYEPTKETTDMDYKTVTSVNEPLDNDTKNKRTKAYDKLHVAHEVYTEPSHYYPNTMISCEEQRNYEPIDETTEMENKTATTEYEQLEYPEEYRSMHVYNQIRVAYPIRQTNTLNP
ncbi:unnamed protein product [Mytilus coruscus]|uniref:Uncharacterized protein n=1 Tax=Mytilus coruscus TaxID=42192 RepID=A0A6J8DIM5_MYTCO|nr:unnamed protein product [Mytilus coruscus]